MKNLLKITFKDLIFIFLGSALLGAGIAWYADPLGLVTGGVTGISIIISQISEFIFGFPISLAFLNIAINIPIFIWSFILFGFDFVKKSLLGMIFLSFWIFVFQNIHNPFEVGDDIFLGTILSGVLAGVGLAWVLKTGATTGGTEMLAACFNRFIPHFSLSKFIFIIDAVVIGGGFFVFGVRCTMYAIVSVFITTRIIDAIIGGLRFAKAVYIISDFNDKISNEIFEQIGRGNTGIYSKGMYSKEKKDMLFVVVSPKQLPLLKSIVSEIDPKAFVTICPAQEVLGEGFLEININT